MDIINVLIGLSQNFALVFALVFVYSIGFKRLKNMNKYVMSLIIGLIFGIIAIVCMQIPIRINEGIVIDARVVLVALSASMGGGISALISALLVGVYRIHLGGIGMIPGLLAIAFAAIVATFFSMKKIIKKDKFYNFFVLGILVSVTSLLATCFLPKEVLVKVFGEISLPTILLYTFGMLIYGNLFIYEIKRAETEEELKKLNCDLEDRVKERTQDMQNAREESESANRAKSEFLANMSHEIRTPINAITGFNYLLYKSEINAKQKTYVDKTILAAKSLLCILNDILDFSKIEANKIEIEYSEFDLYEVIDNVTNILSEIIYEKNLTFLISVDTDVPQVLRGDAYRLHQILLNITNNAVKFTEKGNVQLKVTLEKENEENILIGFEVKDTGIGISKDHIKRLFEPFSQADSSTSRKYGGTGLGLVLSKRLIELMGGSIQIESEEGIGSKFKFSILFKNSDKKVLIENSSLKLKFLRILVVSGNKEVSEVLSQELLLFGFIVKVVNNTEDALYVINYENNYNIIFLEWNLYSTNFYQEMIKGMRDGILVLLVVSNQRDKQIEVKAQEENIRKVIYYPIGQSQLYNEILELFDKEIITENTEYFAKDENFLILKNKKVLLVEDNEMNQLVAMEILNDVNMIVEIATNGKIAVEMFDANDYDIILMDLQMPIMNGLEATKNIRGRERGKNIPILALTAEVVLGVSESVYEAGMDSYITKPFDPKHVLKTLRDIFSKKNSKENVYNEKEYEDINLINNIDNEFLEDFQGINTTEALERINWKKDKYIEMLNLFKDKQCEDADKIRKAYFKGDLEAAIRIAHTLKSAASFVGANEVAKIAFEIQHELKSNSDLRNLEELLKVLGCEINIVKGSIDKFINHTAAKQQSL